MKLHLELGGVVIEFEHRPMPEVRFRALCSLAMYAIAGGVLVALVHMAGVWAVVWAVGALMLVGLYRLVREGLK